MNIENFKKRMPIMFARLPIIFDNDNIGCILDEYVEDLKKYCASQEIELVYDESRNVTIMYYGDDDSKLLEDRCRGFNFVRYKTPFIEILYPNFNKGQEFSEKKEEKQNCLFSYFENSLFHDAIYHPNGSNIVLKKSTDGLPYFFTSSCRYQNIKTNETNWEDFDLNKKIEIGGSFRTVDLKGRISRDDPHYINNERVY